MGAHHRIALVDDDLRVRQLLEYYLRPPEFDLVTFAGGHAALRSLRELRPHLIVCDIVMPDMDGRAFFEEVRRTNGLEAIPFIFLSAVRDEAEIRSALAAGAEAFLVKPFPVRRLTERIRACLKAHAGDAFRDRADGSTAAPAPRPDGETREEPGPTRREDAPEPAPRTAAHESRDTEPGRFSTFDLDGRRVQILTEYSLRPRFTITTIIARQGEGVRKIETSWSHPLQRSEDRDLIRRQVEQQHARAISSIEELLIEPPTRRVVWSEHSRRADGALLARALTMLAREADLRPGEAAAGALRRAQTRIARRHELLRFFRVKDDGRVLLDSSRRALPDAATVASAEWALAFVAEAGLGRGGPDSVRHLTASLNDELERAGFYQAVQAAAQRSSRDGWRVSSRPGFS